MDPTLDQRWSRLTSEQQRLHLAIANKYRALGGHVFHLVPIRPIGFVISFENGTREVFNPMSLILNLERLRKEGLVDYSNQSGVYLLQPSQDGIEMADAVQEPKEAELAISSEQASLGRRGRKVCPDPAQTERGKIRSAWLDKALANHPEWTSNKDIEANGGPTYNTIRRYRSGATSTQERYVRGKLARAFQCAITEVPR